MTVFVLHVAQYAMPKMAYDEVGSKRTFISRDYDISDLVQFPDFYMEIPRVGIRDFVKRFRIEYRLYYQTDVWEENGRMYELQKLKLRIMNETQSLIFKMEFSEFVIEID